MIRLENILKIFLQGVLKTSWRCLEDVFARRLEAVLKTFLKTSSEDEDDRRLQDIFIKTNVCWKSYWRRSYTSRLKPRKIIVIKICKIVLLLLLKKYYYYVKYYLFTSQFICHYIYLLFFIFIIYFQPSAIVFSTTGTSYWLTDSSVKSIWRSQITK